MCLLTRSDAAAIAQANGHFVVAVVWIVMVTGSALFLPMSVLMFHELLLLPVRHWRIIATVLAASGAYLTLYLAFVVIVAISTPQDFTEDIRLGASVLVESGGWTQMVAAALAAVVVYRRGLFRLATPESKQPAST